MKKYLYLFLLCFPAWVAAQQPLYFATEPALSPDAREIYFCYDGGIWKVPAGGGTAARVTAMTGYESRPRVSPDGKWLAFTSDEQGNKNVYVTPTTGGEIRQLTFHQAKDEVASWSADSKYIYFESDRYNILTTYRVSVEGGTPERLFTGFFNTVSNLVENPVDGTFYFNLSGESFNYPSRKGYKGDHNPDIKAYHPSTEQFRQLTTYRGKDIQPTVDRNGNVYWICDENNQDNLAVLKDGKTVMLTSFETGIQRPQVSHNGEKVVFVRDYQIHLYDVASGNTVTPEIKVFRSHRPGIDLAYEVQGKITSIDVSPDGKKLAFVSRGLLFVSDAKGQFVKSIPTDPKERVIEVKWAKDNTTLYYTRTRQGWYNLYKIAADLPSAEKAIYEPDAMIKSLTFNNALTYAAFVTGSTKLEQLNVATDQIEKIADNEFWSFQNYTMSYSSDDRYLAYTAMNLFERDIFIYDTRAKTVLNLTNSAVSENSPAWSPDGKYLYLTANRYNSSFPRGSRGNLFRIRLDQHAQPYRTQQLEQLFNDKDDKKQATQPAITIDMENLVRRWEPLQQNGSQSNVRVFTASGKNYLLYGSNHEGSTGVYLQELLDFDQKPAKKIQGLTMPWQLCVVGKDLYALQSGDVYKVDVSSANPSASKIDLKHSFTKNNDNEFHQMFYEVWAQLAENFYDTGFRGSDWKARQHYYGQFLPYVKSRKDLTMLVNDMLGELNSSHLGFNSSGKEEGKATQMYTFETGIRFENDRPYVVSSLLAGSPAAHRESKIRPGDQLVAVDGIPVDAKVNRNVYFTTPVSKKEMKLTFARDQATYTEILHTASYGQMRNLYYQEWEDECRDRVTRQTQGRVAYHHMRDMTDGSLNKFIIDMTTDAVHKDALILDLRYNNGGNVHDEVIEYLTRRSHFTWKYRDHQENTHPNVMPGDKPLVVLINERSLSDAEVTSNGIKELGAGKLIGTETYRWIIFTSGCSMVDGSSCRLPAWGCYNLQGEDMEFAGVSPDIYVKNTFVDRIHGNDPQLERAIEEILKDLAKK